MHTCIICVLIAAASFSAPAAQDGRADCDDPRTCRELALEARSRGAYETFHDLAWRAVQTARPNDPDAMYLLARAQALSGRRRDAVITLRRLAEAGFGSEAADEPDFRRVRELSEWQVVVDIVKRPRPEPPLRASTLPTAALRAPAVTPPRRALSATVVVPAAPPPRSLRLEPAAVEEAARFSVAPFTAGGLAYDAVAKRFLFGDVGGRRLFVVGEGSNRTMDLVRAESAGFEDVTAFAIDAKRGRLWVASTGAESGALHHLQLISGRPLAKFAVAGRGAVRLADVSVGGSGAVFILESAAPRVLMLQPGATALIELMRLSVSDAVSLAVDEGGRFAYVAHRDGIARLDLTARRAAPMQSANGVSLAGFEFVRLNGNVLVGSQRQPDGSRGLVRLSIAGDRLVAATLIETLPAGAELRGPPTISGGDLYYLVADSNSDPSSGLVNARVRRVKLR